MDVGYTEQDRLNDFIADNILWNLNRDLRESSFDIIGVLLKQYVNREGYVLDILGYASEQGKFIEYVDKLIQNYSNVLFGVAPEVREDRSLPLVLKSDENIVRWFNELVPSC